LHITKRSGAVRIVFGPRFTIGSSSMSKSEIDDTDAQLKARRTFLMTCGKFAIITPPAISLLLASSKQSFAVAASGGGGGGHANNGFGNGPNDGIPGNSGGKGANGKKNGPITDIDR
jgi:hypothetical protein